MSRGRTAGVVVLLVLVLSGAVTSTVGLVRSLAPVDEARNQELAVAQLAYLVPAVAAGADDDMARLFPEGRELTQSLVALAALDLASAGDLDAEAALAASDEALSVLRDPATAARFGVVGGGVFLQGWTLQVDQRRAALTGSAADTRRAQDGAVRLAAVLRAGLDDGEPFLESYPGRRWPVDTVVAVSALARTGGDDALVARWVQEVGARTDPATGLLPHEVDRSMEPIDGPRGTSTMLESAFWPDIDADVAAARWPVVVDTFVVRRAGLVGVREHPAGGGGGLLGDVDSGPLVAGVSLSASAVALAGARRHGEDELARSLQGQAEWAGAPVQAGPARRYAAGVLPVADAFLAWARTQPRDLADLADPVPVEGRQSTSTRAVLWPWPTAGLLVSLLLGRAALRLVRGRRPARQVSQDGSRDEVAATGQRGIS